MPTCGECQLYRPIESSDSDFSAIVNSARATLDALNPPSKEKQQDARRIIFQYYLGTLRRGFSCISDEATVLSCRLCQVPCNFSPTI